MRCSSLDDGDAHYRCCPVVVHPGARGSALPLRPALLCQLSSARRRFIFGTAARRVIGITGVVVIAQ